LACGPDYPQRFRQGRSRAVVRYIRNHFGRRVKPNIKVILTSAYDRESVTISTVQEGEASFIRKPYQLNELVLKLQDTLSNGSSQSHNILELHLGCSP